MPLLLMGCDKYSYDDPNKMIKNMWSKHVYMAYPYIDKSNASVAEAYFIPEGITKIEEMTDIENVIVDGFKKVKSFKKVNEIKPTTDKRVLFSFNHQISKNCVSLTYFTLYADGNLYCYLYYPDSKLNLHSKVLNYTFDADIASEIYDNCYAEFDRAKVELETFFDETISFTHFLTTIDENSAKVYDYDSHKTVMDENKEINQEFKKLVSEVKDENLIIERPITDYGQTIIEYSAVNSERDGYHFFDYNGYMFTTYRVTINDAGTCLGFTFDGHNKYGMWEESRRYYQINPEIGKPVVDSIRKATERICK